MCLLEGSNLTISCLYTRQYASSLKAWQRVRSRGPPETLVRTDTRNADLNIAQDGRYLLEDDPTEVMFRVTVRELQRQDEGLYQCVIDLSPRTPVVLPPQIRLVPCDGEQPRGEGCRGCALEPQAGMSASGGGFGERAQSHEKPSIRNQSTWVFLSLAL